RFSRDWSSDVCSSDLVLQLPLTASQFVQPEGTDHRFYIRDLSFTYPLQHFFWRSGYQFHKLAFVQLGISRHQTLREEDVQMLVRSEERRVGKECRCGW